MYVRCSALFLRRRCFGRLCFEGAYQNRCLNGLGFGYVMPLGFEYFCFPLWVLILMVPCCTPVHLLAGQSTELVFLEACLRHVASAFGRLGAESWLRLQGWGCHQGNSSEFLGIQDASWRGWEVAATCYPPSERSGWGQQEERGAEHISSHRQGRHSSRRGDCPAWLSLPREQLKRQGRCQ